MLLMTALHLNPQSPIHLNSRQFLHDLHPAKFRKQSFLNLGEASSKFKSTKTELGYSFSKLDPLTLVRVCVLFFIKTPENQLFSLSIPPSQQNVPPLTLLCLLTFASLVHYKIASMARTRPF